MKGKKLTLKERQAKLEEDKNERKKIFKELCDHVRAGYSLDCFGPLSEVSIRKYLKVYQEEFIQEELDAALRESKTYWEGIGRRQANGECLGNSRSRVRFQSMSLAMHLRRLQKMLRMRNIHNRDYEYFFLLLK